MKGKFYPHPLISTQSDLGRRADSRWALPQISSFIYFILLKFIVKLLRINQLKN